MADGGVRRAVRGEGRRVRGFDQNGWTSETPLKVAMSIIAGSIGGGKGKVWILFGLCVCAFFAHAHALGVNQEPLATPQVPKQVL